MKKRKKKLVQLIDGLNPKDIENIRKALRQVWSWSYPRKLCIARATDKNGFGRCELCRKRVPKLFADHIRPVGLVDAGFIDRMWCSSKFLQALCKKCHDKKTRQERKDLEIEKGFY